MLSTPLHFPERPKRNLAYVHAGGTHGVLVNLAVEGGIDPTEIGKNVAMQIAAMSPKRLLAQVSYSSSRPIRLLGLSVSNPLADDGLRQSQWVEGDLPFEEW